jgi:hypothetical protein
MIPFTAFALSNRDNKDIPTPATSVRSGLVDNAVVVNVAVSRLARWIVSSTLKSSQELDSISVSRIVNDEAFELPVGTLRDVSRREDQVDFELLVELSN